MNTVRKAVIPAAGFGTRFLPATKAQPKEMLPVIDTPVIQYVVEEIVKSGIKEILIITGRGKRAIEDHFDRSTELEEMLKEKGKNDAFVKMREIAELADIHYIRQQEQRGLGDAIHCAKSFTNGEPFVVLLGDTIMQADVPVTKQLINFYNKYQSSIIAVEQVPREKISRYGIVGGKEVEPGVLELDTLVEKPQPEEAPSSFGVTGRYLLTPAIFEMIEKTSPGKGGEIQITDALKLLLQKEKIYAANVKGKRYDIGNKLD